MWLKLTSRKSISLCKLQNRLSFLLSDKSFCEEVNNIRRVIMTERDALSGSKYNVIRNDPPKYTINKYHPKQKLTGPNTFYDNNSGIVANYKESNIYGNGAIVKSEPQSDSDDSFIEYGKNLEIKFKLMFTSRSKMIIFRCSCSI